jgi:uncharacterized membrane protein
LGLHAPLGLRLRTAPGGHGAGEADPGHLAQPVDQRRVVVAEPERHETSVRLAAVGLSDPEMRFALEKARDEMSVGVRKANHLQIVAFQAADSCAE